MPFGFFSSIINRYFDPNKTIATWKYGIINRNESFIIKVSFTNSSLTISAKAIDPEKLFNFTSEKHLHYLQFMYMEYYIYIKHLLRSHFISYDVNIIIIKIFKTSV